MPYIGSSNVETTNVPNFELVITPVAWVGAKMNLKHVALMPETDCHISVNTSAPIFLRAYQTWSITVDDKNHLDLITSLKIVEQNTIYTFIGAY